MSIILGIESSCDDTSAAIIRDGVLLSNVIASQSVHEAYGGVVPELASRAHQQNIVPVVSEAINRAGISKTDISAIAFTAGPGLIGSLLVGTQFAKGLSTALGIQLVCVKHLHGLTRCVQEGFEAWAVFIIQMKGVKYFEPNRATHPEFAEALCQAANAGVKLMALDCDVTKNSLTALEYVEICL